MKKGNILMENVVYILLILLFFGIMFVFVYRQASNVSLIEESAAKQIALVIDAAKPGTQIVLNFNKIIEKKHDDFHGETVRIDNVNKFVKVQLSAKSGFSYGFFNNINIQYSLNEEGYLTLIV